MSQCTVGRSFSRGTALLAVAAGLTLGGCVMPHETRELGVVARDISSGETLEGVRIYRHVDKPGVLNAPADAVATTDPAGIAVFATPRLNSKWLVMRDGYEPMLVDVREGGVTPEARGHELVVQWADVMKTGVLELPMAPITWRTVRIQVVDSATGEPVAGASVLSETFSVLDRESGGTLFGVPVEVGTLTNEFGAAMIDLPSGSTCTVTVAAEGHAGARVVLDPESPEGVSTRTTVPLQAYRYEPTRVVVLDRETGLPVEGATVRVGLLDPTTGEGCRDSLWTTDAEGIAIVMKPNAGLGTLTVEHDGRLPGEFRVIEIHATEFTSIAIGAEDTD